MEETSQVTVRFHMAVEERGEELDMEEERMREKTVEEEETAEAMEETDEIAEAMVEKTVQSREGEAAEAVVEGEETDKIAETRAEKTVKSTGEKEETAEAVVEGEDEMDAVGCWWCEQLWCRIMHLPMARRWIVVNLCSPLLHMALTCS